jgi:hypothetical protein
LRNQRYVNEAKLSTAIAREITAIARSGGHGLVVIKDVRDARPTAEQAFGALAGQMGELVTGGAIQLWIDPPPAELSSARPPDLSSAVGTLVVERGRVRRE